MRPSTIIFDIDVDDFSYLKYDYEDKKKNIGLSNEEGPLTKSKRILGNKINSLSSTLKNGLQKL